MSTPLERLYERGVSDGFDLHTLDYANTEGVRWKEGESDDLWKALGKPRFGWFPYYESIYEEYPRPMTREEWEFFRREDALRAYAEESAHD